MTRRVVGVDVATVWTSPSAARPIDEPAVRDVPDPQAWVASLDAEARLGLHGRTLTQLLLGEPVDVHEETPDGWLSVSAPWQPAPEHEDGYRGWVRAAHVSESAVGVPAAPPGEIRAGRLEVLAEARRFLGLQYLWGGMSPWGLDCSGLVHFANRRAGVVVPRDAYAQHAVTVAVPIDEAQPGDLYFFARQDGRVFHVGFVTGPQRMLHAPETRGGGLIEEVLLPPERLATLVAAGRLLDAS
jgi:gamma-D-glutamyl-L-lysine dipeptidyl-peptidase